MASFQTMLLTQFLCLSLCVYSVWTDPPETGSCTLEAGRNLTYWHIMTNKQMFERETVANGAKLRVKCPVNDYDYSVYYDNDKTNGEHVSQEYIECVDGAFTNHTLACEIDTKSPPEAQPSPKKCTAIANGQITDRGKSFTCNTDFKPSFKNGMDAILYTRYSCTCNQISGRLQCMGTEVECTPIGCQIPSHVQQGMTLYDPRERRTISAANRYEIQHNQSLIFSCEPSDVFYFEPNRRMFDCVKGSWVFKKRSDMDTWEFKNNGSFPECRKVVCPADYCKFGGHCIRDHECKCPEQTIGKQCETPLCNTECQNGGKCVSPDRCQCPEGFDGGRCENDINECATAPCKNGATCSNLLNAYLCKCIPGWQGKNCDQALCNPECQNGGTCVLPDVCNCPDRFCGKHCEIVRVCSTDEYLVKNDSTLSVSSQYFHPLYPTESEMFGADQGRLNSVEEGWGTSFRAGIWMPAVNDTNPYIQVNFTVLKIITSIVTKGRPRSWHQLFAQWVTHYRFMYSIDCKTFITYTDMTGAPMMFWANIDGDSIQANKLPCPVLAKCARVNPIGWRISISMKFDIGGCDVSSLTDV